MENQDKLKVELANALGELSKTEAVKVVKERGEPIWSPFFWPDRELEAVEVELFSIVRLMSDSKWAVNDRYLQWCLRQLLWVALKEPVSQSQIEAAVSEFLSKVTVKLGEFPVLIQIQGLRPTKVAVIVGGVTLGILEDFVNRDTAREILVESEGKISVWGSFKVKVPSAEHVASTAVRKIDGALDLLGTIAQRSRISGGNPGEVKVGQTGFLFTEGRWRRFGIMNEWGIGWGYTLDPATVQNEAMGQYKTGPFPWEKLQSDSELSVALKEAYRRFGHARRISMDPEAAIPLALSAIESLLSARDDKRFSAAGRLILASIALGQPTMWPLALVEWFERRNEILHEPSQTTWTQREASSAFWSLYGVLDLISNFIISGKLERREDLLRKLLTRTNVAEAKKGIEAEITRVKELLTKAVSREYKQELGRTIELWGEISSGLRPTDA